MLPGVPGTFPGGWGQGSRVPGADVMWASTVCIIPGSWMRGSLAVSTNSPCSSLFSSRGPVTTEALGPAVPALPWRWGPVLQCLGAVRE